MQCLPSREDKKVVRILIPFVLRDYMLKYMHEEEQCTDLYRLNVMETIAVFMLIYIWLCKSLICLILLNYNSHSDF